MTRSEWLWLSFGLVAAVMACFLSVTRVWRGELLGRDAISKDAAQGAAFVRSAPTGCFMFLGFMIICFAAGLLSPEGGTAPAWLAVVTFVFLGVCMVLLGTIIAFNVPRALVPPERRDERGLLSTKQNNRSGGPAAEVDRPASDRR